MFVVQFEERNTSTRPPPDVLTTTFTWPAVLPRLTGLPTESVTEAISMDGGTVIGTMTALTTMAAPALLLASAVDVAMLVTVPPEIPVTLPDWSTVAAAELLVVQETVLAVVASAVTEAASVMVVPTLIDAFCGDTETLCTPVKAATCVS